MSEFSEQGPRKPPEPKEARRINSRDILGEDREVLIIHGQDIYRLRETKNGKLILQK